ncbi:unnamed protein product [Urochloa humidicola]
MVADVTSLFDSHCLLLEIGEQGTFGRSTVVWRPPRTQCRRNYLFIIRICTKRKATVTLSVSSAVEVVFLLQCSMPATRSRLNV